MKLLLKNWLLLNSELRKQKHFLFSTIVFLLCFSVSSQIANYINNGSFEEISIPPGWRAKYWGATDTNKVFGELLSKVIAPFKVPLCSYTYQWPRHGNNHLIGLQYCSTCPNNNR